MQIAFWSPNHGQTGTTTAAMTYAAYMALTNNFKVLVAHSQMYHSTLEACLIEPKKKAEEEWRYFKDHGLSALRRLVKSGRLLSGIISDYTTSLLPNMSLDLLEGSNEIKSYSDEEETAILRHIFLMADSDYDMVFLDVHSGMNYDLTKKILEDSDIIIVCLNQNRQLIERFLKEESALLAGKQCVYHLGFYDEESKYSLKNLQRKYQLETVMALPYHTPYLDACNNHQALDYLMRHLTVKPKHPAYFFMKTIEESMEKLMERTRVMDQEVFDQHD